MYLLSPWLIGIFALLAALRAGMRRQWEHCATRVLLGAFYVGLSLYPDMPIETARLYSRYFIFLVFFIEVLSWTLITFARRAR